MGQLSLRQFFLLLAEWWNEQRRQDLRAYMFVITQCVGDDRPQPEDLFDSFRLPASQQVLEVDEVENFRQIQAQLGAL